MFNAMSIVCQIVIDLMIFCTAHLHSVLQSFEFLVLVAVTAEVVIAILVAVVVVK